MSSFYADLAELRYRGEKAAVNIQCSFIYFKERG